MGRWGLRINENVSTIGGLRKELALPSVGKETGVIFYQWLLIVIQVDDHHPVFLLHSFQPSGGPDIANLMLPQASELISASSSICSL